MRSISSVAAVLLLLLLLSRAAAQTPTPTPTPTPTATPTPTPTPEASPPPSPPFPPPPPPEEEDVYDGYYQDQPPPPPPPGPPSPLGPGGASPTPGNPVIFTPPSPPPPSPPPPPAQVPPSELIAGDSQYRLASPVHTYPLDWEQVPIDPGEGTSQQQQLITEVGGCGCDLTLRGCDPNCCCDEDCTAETQKLFTACLPEGGPPPSLQYCISDSMVAQVNLPSSSSLGIVYKESADPESFTEQLMCVVNDNNPVLGVYFMDPPDGTEDDLTDVPPSWPEDTTEGEVIESESYLVGEAIPAAFATASGDVPVPGGILALPTARFSAACDATSPVYFGLNLPQYSKGSNTCQQLFDRLEDACVNDLRSPLSSDLLIRDLRVSSPTANLRVDVSELRFRNLDGTVVELPVPPSLPELTFANNICNNSLVGIDYTIICSQTGVIDQVTASVTLAEVQGDINGAAAVEQDFSMQFVEPTNVDTARPSSGSPGYLDGFPLLAGIAATEPVDDPDAEPKQAVLRLVDGLPLPAASPRDGTCGVEWSQPVIFGADAISVCTVPFTLAQLRDYCKQESEGVPTGLIPLQLMGGLLDPDQPTLIGRWGNSDELNTNEWLKIVNNTEPDPDGMAWDPNTATCTGVITGIEFEFLTNLVGASYNPQAQVSYARAQFIRSSWQFRNQVLYPNEAEYFQVTNRVQFVAQEQEPAEDVRGNNPFILPRLPSDVFYPFTSAATPLPSRPLYPLLVAALLSYLLAAAAAQQ